MNRRTFFTRASAFTAGLMATCGLLPELATAQPPKDYVGLIDAEHTVSNAMFTGEETLAISDQIGRQWRWRQQGMRATVSVEGYLDICRRFPHSVYIVGNDSIANTVTVEWR